MQEFVHNDFVIGFPLRWIDSSVVILAGPQNDGYSPNITITRERLEFQLTAAEYAANQLMVLQQDLSQEGYQVVEEGSLSLTGLTAYQRVHTFRMSDANLQLKQMQVYVVRGKEAITITCTNTAEWFDRTKLIFTEAIKQFRWRGPIPQSGRG